LFHQILRVFVKSGWRGNRSSPIISWVYWQCNNAGLCWFTIMFFPNFPSDQFNHKTNPQSARLRSDTHSQLQVES
jgi:hypothetical protein